MIRGNGFLQMFSISPVGGGGAGAHLDFHLDTHNIVNKTDYGKQEEARQESVHKGSSVSTDKDGRVHIYERGCELASNDDRSDRTDRNNFMSDDGKWNG